MKASLDELSQKISVTLQNGTKKILPLVSTLKLKVAIDGKHSNNGAHKLSDINMRVPSVIHKVCAAKTSQYWENVMRYDKEALNEAGKISQAIISHLQGLQKQSIAQSTMILMKARQRMKLLVWMIIVMVIPNWTIGN